MGQIYLVRNGQTAWNKARIFRGRMDVRMNEQGRRETHCAAQALRDIPLKRVYCSPLSRARETAEIIKGVQGIHVCVESALRDMDFGEWTEYWDLQARRKFKEDYLLWETAPHRFKFPGGESLEDVRRRVMPRFKELRAAHRNDSIALVTHRVVLKLILCEAKGWDISCFWNIRCDTGGISVLAHDSGGLRVVVENETQHLQMLKDHDSVDF